MPSFRRTFEQLHIGGEWVPPDSRRTINVISPTDEDVIGSVPSANAVDVDRAVAAARRALERGEWADSTPEDRLRLLRRVRELMAECSDELAVLVTEEMGCPIAQSRALQVGSVLTLVDDLLDVGEAFAYSDLRQSRGGQALVVREAVGVVAAIVPWNVPLSPALIKLTPALLAGCTVVLKPAPQTPLTAFALAQIFEDAGLPGGVLSVIPAELEASEYLVSHPDVDKVAFTGSSAAGRRIAAVCGELLRPVTLELGGKSAGIILDDADLDRTMELLRMGTLRNNGQVCTLKTRVLVSRRRAAEVTEALAAMVSSLSVGDPRLDATDIGPLVSAQQRQRVQSYIDRGRGEGATVVAGGRAPAQDRGWFVTPTVFADVDPSMVIAREEIFGPVACVIAYDDEDDAIRIANDSAYGLSGAVYTADPERGLAVARRIRSGVVEVDGAPIGFRAPFGGVKASGLGREAGREGFEAYTRVASYGLPPSLFASLRGAGESHERAAAGPVR